MITNFAEWYEKEQVKDLYETWDYPELPNMLAAFPHGLHQYDKKGQPIIVRRLGQTDFDALFASTSIERLMRHITWQNEELKYLVCAALSKKFNKAIESNCQIADLRNISLRKLASRQVMNALQTGLSIFQNYYPETLGNIYIVNAPALFSGVYSIIKGFLDERTRSKVKIMGSNYQ